MTPARSYIMDEGQTSAVVVALLNVIAENPGGKDYSVAYMVGKPLFDLLVQDRPIGGHWGYELGREPITAHKGKALLDDRASSSSALALKRLAEVLPDDYGESASKALDEVVAFWKRCIEVTGGFGTAHYADGSIASTRMFEPTVPSTTVTNDIGLAAKDINPGVYEFCVQWCKDREGITPDASQGQWARFYQGKTPIYGLSPSNPSRPTSTVHYDPEQRDWTKGYQWVGGWPTRLLQGYKQ